MLYVALCGQWTHALDKIVSHNSMPCAYTQYTHVHMFPDIPTGHAQWFLCSNLIESAMCLWHKKHEENVASLNFSDVNECELPYRDDIVIPRPVGNQP